MEETAEHAIRRLTAQLGALEQLLAVYEAGVREQAATIERTMEQLRASQARFQDILQTASDAVLCIDERQQIIVWNQQAEMIFGYQAHEAIGQPIDVVIPARFRTAHQDHVKRFALEDVSHKMMSERTIIRALRKNGEEFPVEVAISKVKVENRWIFTAMVRDITERVKTQEALNKERGELVNMNSIMMDREARVLELKQEVNALLKALNQSPRYHA